RFIWRSPGVPSKTRTRKRGKDESAQDPRRLRRNVEQQARELAEAREQQLATAEVLKAISRSDFNLESVLTALIGSAARLCGANFGQIFRWDGTALRWAAGFALTPEFRETQRHLVYRPGRETLVARTALELRVTVIEDALADPEYAHKEF